MRDSIAIACKNMADVESEVWKYWGRFT